ncbi:response regulator receiver protein (plasmid) [Herpetosiphon aurantiacus DSM 785]|uniref:Response regulator receiver protein n=1 Tax=Herpetosiphon aurantiacus (strain ATCC 23779 / DSM 785 / 114-95) TaxID=316274 RepID=A9B910_HERA2|nr:response regulator receiver protein [Herpetosiphon aurantiacus DSM 785]
MTDALHILLVEDQAMNRDMLTRRFERHGYTVSLALNGAEAVVMAQAVMPDVIVMDMSLPVMDGWSATQRLKAIPIVQDIPIIAVTAYAMTGDRERCFAVGCSEYEAKPIQFGRLVEKIERWGGVRRSHMHREHE